MGKRKFSGISINKLSINKNKKGNATIKDLPNELYRNINNHVLHKALNDNKKKAYYGSAYGSIYTGVTGDIRNDLDRKLHNIIHKNKSKFI